MHIAIYYHSGTMNMIQKHIINPRSTCATRVIVVVRCICMCVCVCVCVCVCMCVHSNLPLHTLKSQKRDANKFIAIQGSF